MNTKPYRPYGGRRRHPILAAALVLLGLAVLLFAALECYIGVHSRTQISPGEDAPEVMVIFGCQVRPDGPSILLKDRLTTALTYLDSHPDTTVVVSGGKGDDEHLSEAQAMYDYLTAHSFPGNQILREDQSRNTWENVRFTQALLEREGIKTDKFLLVSNGFHLSRIKLLWSRAWGGDRTPSTLAAPVSHKPSQVQMFFREPVALVKSFLFDR